MRFSYQDYTGQKTGPYTAEEAVAHQAEKEASLCDGELERMRAKIDALAGLLGRLIDEMPTPTKAHAKRLADVIGSNWYLEEH